MTPLPSTKVDIEPLGKRLLVRPGARLFDILQKTGAGLASACGGEGTCGQCRVVIRSGEVSPPSEQEQEILTPAELHSGVRLACRLRVLSDVHVFIPRSSLITGQRLQLEGQSNAIEVDPPVRSASVQASPPTLQDLRADLERVADAWPEGFERTTGALRADPEVMRQLSQAARENDWQLAVFRRGSEIVGAAPPKTKMAGVAIDLGTTKIAAALIDMQTGEGLAVTGALNPQIGYGEDIISRLAYARRNPQGGQDLAQMVQTTLDELIGALSKEAGVRREQIAEVCVVGNTAMTHLFAGLPVEQLARSPYVAATTHAMEIKARDLGLHVAPGAYVYILPGLSGFVGPDHVAMIVAAGLDRASRVTLGVDIGTNTEISLARPGEPFLASASCASGPAFEGAHISDGMRAAPGAIEAVRLTSEGLHLSTIEDAPAIGLCGSGIVDAISVMVQERIINRHGRFQPASGPSQRQGRHGPEWLLVPAKKSGSGRDVVVTQKDVNEIQLAKGAIHAGIEVLMEATGTPFEAVEEVVIAGAFGSYINVESALNIGLLPRFPNAQYRQVGNAAIVGARLALLSIKERDRAERIAAQTRYIELTTYPKFNRRFALGMLFPANGA